MTAACRQRRYANVVLARPLPWQEGMENNTRTKTQQERIEAGVPFVGAMARRLAASMPHSIDLGDLVQDGMLGLIDAVERFDEARGIKFETFAERRVRGAMIDALRRGAWPRGIRRVRRELETARQKLRNELGGEPSLSDLANHIGTDEASLGRTINRINIIESTSPLATADTVENTDLPPVLTPSESPAPDKVCEEAEVNNRVRAAIAALPGRERKIIGLYYYGDATMKEIGAAIGVNESRVSQLHARAIRRLREQLAPDLAPEQLRMTLAATVSETPRLARPRLKMAKANLSTAAPRRGTATKQRAVRC